MFAPGSRYENAGTFEAVLHNGRRVLCTRLPVREPTRPIGFHPRAEGDRLDLLAARYLGDPTTFWKVCDANASVVPDALAARSLIGIPRARA